MNPSFKFFLALIISLEISLKSSLCTNLLIIGFALIYLIYKHIKLKNLLLTLLMPLIAAFTVFATLYWFAPQPNLQNALSLASRVYVYTLTIYCVSIGTTATDLARSFEQNFHLPSKFAYGVLAALNIVPRMKTAVKQIRTAGMMRGVYLSFWSPVLYFKAILVALNSAENLAQGMASHGYQENAKRSVIVPIPIKKSDWLTASIILLLVNLALFTLK
ncbi:energy-coupling factor transporter transmembrane component T family protein [Lactobacillus helsingborgensis]|uniref:energy-coupling factor transporter transmembrane component T family protein n=1 Tax=Lactobacillus helsingborgensis TaxID=1218494 RepID=UPI0022641B7B|nr:energy-coupling factor transporter transmembrane component T [Lactobacillus helsingborgensis]UZX31659.1 energy-coupling factor transporter transmembrane protein EcfT [Lactobacillus helsingborgensis]